MTFSAKQETLETFELTTTRGHRLQPSTLNENLQYLTDRAAKPTGPTKRKNTTHIAFPRIVCIYLLKLKVSTSKLYYQRLKVVNNMLPSIRQIILPSELVKYKLVPDKLISSPNGKPIHKYNL